MKKIPLKYVSLITLTLQNTTQVLVMKYSRLQPGDKYITSIAVAVHELLKLISCLIIITYQENGIKGMLKVYYFIN